MKTRSLVVHLVVSLLFTKTVIGTRLDGNNSLINLLELQMDHCSTVSLCTIKSPNNASLVSSAATCCKSCSCDNDCKELGTCCPDFRLADVISDTLSNSIADLSDRLNNLNSTITEELLENRDSPRDTQGLIACVEAKAITNDFRFESKRLPNSFLMVNICPLDFEGDSEMERKCIDNVPLEDFENNKNDPDLTIPVTSFRTNKTYKNLYCFQCNEGGHVGSKFSVWRVIMFCASSKVFYNYDNPYTLFRQITSAARFYSCNLLYTPRTEVKALISRCDPVDIYKCPVESDKQLKHVCGAFHLPVIFTENYRTFKRYRNIACFLCNKEEKFWSKCVDSYPNVEEYSMELNLLLDGHNNILQYNESDLHVLNVTVIKYDGGPCKAGFIPSQELDTCRRVFCPKQFYPLNGSCIPEFTYMNNICFTVMLEVRRNQKLDQAGETEFYWALSKSVDQIADEIFKQFTYGLWKMASDYDILVVSFTTWPDQSTYMDMLTLLSDFLKQTATLQVQTKFQTVETIIMIARGTTPRFLHGQLRKQGQSREPVPPVRTYLGLEKSLKEMYISSAHFCYRVETGPPEVKRDARGISYINSKSGIMINHIDITTTSDGRIIVCIDNIYQNLTDLSASYMFAGAGTSARGNKQFVNIRQEFISPIILPGEVIRKSNSDDMTIVNDTTKNDSSCAPKILFAESIYLCTLVVAILCI